MGWFGKKEDEKKMTSEIPELPKLPELPRLPDFDSNNNSRMNFPDMQNSSSMNRNELQQLPSYPRNSVGNAFSQNAIKDAVSGEEEGDEVEDFQDEEEVSTPRKSRTMEIPMTKGLSRRATYEVPEEFVEADKKVKSAEPIFIRLDKFEDSLATFQKAKSQIHEIEKMLQDIKQVREEEEKELAYWEEQIQTIKSEVEKIDNDLFSKIE